jgi:hypothetical protein
MVTDCDLIVVSFFLTLAIAIVKSIARSGYSRQNGFAQNLAFKTKVKCCIVVNQLINDCRMFDKKPREIVAQCYLCALRGGWFRCFRSKELRKVA